MSEVVILGAGVMGSAMGMPLADNGHRVRLVGTHKDSDVIESVAHDHFHPRLNIHLPRTITAHYHHELDRILDEDVALIVIGVSSPGVTWAAETLGRLRRSSLPPLLMITKGLRVVDGELQVLPHVLARHLAEFDLAGTPVAAVAGPCIAGELAARRPSSVVFTHADRGVLHWLEDHLRTDYYHIRFNTDVVGVEVCAALKNLYALAIGFAGGMLDNQPAENAAGMHNPAAALFGEAMLEMKYLVNFMGGDPASADGLPGSGDLYVTCQGGRNSRMGRLLGRGLRFSKAKAEHMPDDTIEGAQLAQAIAHGLEPLFADGRLDAERLPLMRKVFQTVVHDRPIDLDWTGFHR